MFKKIIFILLIIAGFLLQAQTNYTSLYSRYGIGKVHKKSFADNIGMGYAGIGYANQYRTNILNSASLTAMDSMTFIFNFGLKGEFTLLETQQLSENHYFANISYLSIAFPATHWWFFAAGMRPFSSMGYLVQNTSDVLDNQSNVVTQTTQTFTGEGDINQYYISQAFKLKNLSIGINISYLLGSLNRTTQLVFPSGSAAYNMYSKSKTDINDFYFDFGLQYKMQLTETTKLTLGGIYNIKKNIMSQTSLYLDRYFSNTTIDTIHDGQINKNVYTFPMSIGFGAAIEFDDKLTVLADGKYTNWAAVELYESEAKLENTISLNAGLQYIPEQNSLSYRNKINYRLGGYYQTSYIVLNNEQLKKFGITFGFGFPLRKTGTMFNFGFDLGQYGKKAEKFVRETYFGMHIGFSLYDKWFYKRKFD